MDRSPCLQIICEDRFPGYTHHTQIGRTRAVSLDAGDIGGWILGRSRTTCVGPAYQKGGKPVRSGSFGGLEKAVVGPFCPNPNLTGSGAPVLVFQGILHLIALLRGPGDELITQG
jgi:hypothetical protein